MNNNLIKIGLITCWLGKYPWYLPYYIHSCKFNPTIDFIIITDNIENILNKPNNVKIIYKTTQEIKQIVNKKLGFIANIDYPYKLCDFKPAYGLIFEDYLKKYDFWGHCDLDIIYGNIRSFFTNEFLLNYEYISLRHDYTTGCLSLYLNNLKMNTFFMKSKDYKKVFTSSQHYCFDECNFVWDDLTSGKSIFELETEIESFTHLMKKAEKNKEIKTHFDFILLEGFTGRITFNNGRIYYKNEFEGILFHLFWLKKVYNPIKISKKIPDIYYISKNKIYY